MDHGSSGGRSRVESGQSNPPRRYLLTDGRPDKPHSRRKPGRRRTPGTTRVVNRPGGRESGHHSHRLCGRHGSGKISRSRGRSRPGRRSRSVRLARSLARPGSVSSDNSGTFGRVQSSHREVFRHDSSDRDPSDQLRSSCRPHAAFPDRPGPGHHLGAVRRR